MLCKEWSDLAHTKLMKLVETQNSLLDLISNGFEKPIQKTKSLI